MLILGSSMLVDAHLKKSNLMAAGLIGADSRQLILKKWLRPWASGQHAHGCIPVGEQADGFPAGQGVQSDQSWQRLDGNGAAAHALILLAASGLRLLVCNCRKQDTVRSAFL